MVEWLKIADRKKRETTPVTPQIDAQISHFIFHHYANWFSKEDMAQAFATIPQVHHRALPPSVEQHTHPHAARHGLLHSDEERLGGVVEGQREVLDMHECARALYCLGDRRDCAVVVRKQRHAVARADGQVAEVGVEAHEGLVARGHRRVEQRDQMGRLREGRGALDLVALRYALDVIGGVDSLVMTNLDRLPLFGEEIDVVTRYADTTATFFDGDAIRVRRPFDLAHQEALTRALGEVTPIRERFEVDGYAAKIAERLSLPLRMLSFGATAADKVVKSSVKTPARSRRAERSGNPAPGTSSL